MSYQGWKNYETWHVALMLGQDAGTQQTWLDNAAAYWASAKGKTHDVWTESEQARYELADSLKEYVEEGIDTLDSDNFISPLLLGLMRAGFDEVFWEQIANGFLEQCDGYVLAEYPHQEEGE